MALESVSDQTLLRSHSQIQSCLWGGSPDAFLHTESDNRINPKKPQHRIVLAIALDKFSPEVSAKLDELIQLLESSPPVTPGYTYSEPTP